MENPHDSTDNQKHNNPASGTLIKQDSVIADAPCIIEIKRCLCGSSKVRPLVSAPFYVRWHNGQTVNLLTTLYYCKNCGLVLRGLDDYDPIVVTHFELASYTDIPKEDHWRQYRRQFFNWIIGLAQKHGGAELKTVLDFGCAYGHLLDMFAEKGAKTIGIEVAPQLVRKLKDEGCHQIYSTIETPEIPDGSLDAITAIDSIYCPGVPRPDRLFQMFARKLKPGGVIITRTTNRNQIYKIYALRWHLLHGQFDKPAPISYRVCGDGFVNFSQRAVTWYLTQAGLNKAATYRWERKNKSHRERIRDAIVWTLYCLTLGNIDVCPGLVVVGRK